MWWMTSLLIPLINHQDQSNDTKSITEEDELMEFDALDGGGFVATSSSHHELLFHLLSCVDKEVYFAVDVDHTKLPDASCPSLVLPCFLTPSQQGT
jgi:hypothetical protein